LINRAYKRQRRVKKGNMKMHNVYISLTHPMGRVFLEELKLISLLRDAPLLWSRKLIALFTTFRHCSIS
jgi:hypothetical protein